MCVYSPLNLCTPPAEIWDTEMNQRPLSSKPSPRPLETPEATQMTYCSQNDSLDSLREKHWSLLPELDPWGPLPPFLDQPPQPKVPRGAGTQAGAEKTTPQWKKITPVLQEIESK